MALSSMTALGTNAATCRAWRALLALLFNVDNNMSDHSLFDTRIGGVETWRADRLQTPEK
jgi:hypothetical protein